VFAADGLEEAVLELVLVVVEAPPADVAEAVEEAVAGREDNAASVVNAAERPVTLVQTVGIVPVPVTKLTAAHCWSVTSANGILISLLHQRALSTDLVKDPVWSILYDANNPLGTCPRSRYFKVLLAVITKSCLKNGWKKSNPVS
jgi:hypothetical protein